MDMQSVIRNKGCDFAYMTDTEMYSGRSQYYIYEIRAHVYEHEHGQVHVHTQALYKM